MLTEFGSQGIACWGGGFTDPRKSSHEGKFTAAVKVAATTPHANILIIWRPSEGTSALLLPMAMVSNVEEDYSFGAEGNELTSKEHP